MSVEEDFFPVPDGVIGLSAGYLWCGASIISNYQSFLSSDFHVTCFGSANLLSPKNFALITEIPDGSEVGTLCATCGNPFSRVVSRYLLSIDFRESPWGNIVCSPVIFGSGTVKYPLYFCTDRSTQLLRSMHKDIRLIKLSV